MQKPPANWSSQKQKLHPTASNNKERKKRKTINGAGKGRLQLQPLKMGLKVKHLKEKMYNLKFQIGHLAKKKKKRSQANNKEMTAMSSFVMIFVWSVNLLWFPNFDMFYVVFDNLWSILGLCSFRWYTKSEIYSSIS